MSLLRIATRRSALALWQAEHVAARLKAAHAGLEVELVPMVTQGDRILDRTLAQVGGKGLFIKELEVALQEGRADLAVHSMKDMPADLPDGLMLVAALERADPRDAFVSNHYRHLGDAVPPLISWQLAQVCTWILTGRRPPMNSGDVSESTWATKSAIQRANSSVGSVASFGVGTGSPVISTARKTSSRAAKSERRAAASAISNAAVGSSNATWRCASARTSDRSSSSAAPSASSTQRRA